MRLRRLLRGRTSRCEYRQKLVDAASLVVHGDVPPSPDATMGLARGVLDLDLELEARDHDLEQARKEIARLRAAARGGS